ncbi:ABC transporter ATP-binding protein [Gordonia soli]|uniref:Putative ABC transporter ATP-binding protein n=1 Tax=Gordonia soli NBRC 108243 TaxID=1223545 RepID=M0QPC2_9ACTN|nr:ATP-binding cassette domain-containing protein [Gordonia soli]GAC70126.1 putative ABC transporter ATP-binding protein [Gordonia soli NBRC 108243]
MIEIDSAAVRFRRQLALDDVSLTVADGQVVYLLGRNGAGKSTLLRTVCGVTRPTSGTIRIDGRRLADHPSPATALGMHLDLDRVHPGHTARRHLRWICAAAGLPTGRVGEVLSAVGLSDVADRRLRAYSLGMRQRLGIATALLGDPANLVFDEPLNGLDIDGIIWLRGLLQTLAAEGRSILIASHMFAEVTRTADRVAVIADGRLVADGTVDDLIGDATDLEDAFVQLVSGDWPVNHTDGTGQLVGADEMTAS